jgi:5-(carboxyamino)imidazole ribonucleotide synthase
MDFDTVYDFGKKVDVLTFEIELVNLEALVKLENEGLKVYPSPLKLIQNKGIQKHFIQNIFPPQIIRFNNLKV